MGGGSGWGGSGTGTMPKSGFPKVVAVGSNEDGQCDIPDLEEGVSYKYVAAGSQHTVLLTSDGKVSRGLIDQT